jgi:hypothetical protein
MLLASGDAMAGEQSTETIVFLGHGENPTNGLGQLVYRGA